MLFLLSFIIKFQCFSLDLDIFNKDRGGPKGKLGV